MRTILTSTSFVRSLALLTVSLSCACSAPADPQTQTETSDETAEDALTIAGATGDATFGNHGKLDSPFSLYVAPDGPFAGAHVVNGELVMERRARDGAPLPGFASKSSRRGRKARSSKRWMVAAPYSRHDDLQRRGRT